MIDMPYLATGLFACAVFHTFMVKRLSKLASRFPEGSFGENLLHFLGEVEVVFGFWSAIFIGFWALQGGLDSAAHYLEGIDYTEPVFVFVIMVMAATKPVLKLAENLIGFVACRLPLPPPAAIYLSSLTLGPLLGSLITEPAAMTVTALLLREKFFTAKASLAFKYATLGLLFVNISIGGTLSHFAAPPVLMVAGPWGWDSRFMFANFGWRAILAISFSTLATMLWFKKELQGSLSSKPSKAQATGIPPWVTLVHLGFLSLTILTAHYMSFFLPLFLMFLGWCTVAKEYQEELRIKESLLVAFFLGGLITLGKLQAWWLQPLLAGLGEGPLFWGALALTAITDNAALTYLGTLVPAMSPEAKYALVAGAVAGGGLTVIANAPNPAGLGLLRPAFGQDGVSPVGLFLGALPYTIIAALAFLI